MIFNETIRFISAARVETDSSLLWNNKRNVKNNDLVGEFAAL